MAYDPIGVACTVLYLATNAIATALIGYKTWYAIIFDCHSEYFNNICIRIHRRAMKKYQVTAQARAASVLMLIVESGVGYCLLWVRRFHSALATT